MKREDVRELVMDIAELNEKGWEDTSNDNMMSSIAHVLSTARNCIENLSGEVDELEARIKKLERDR